MAVSDLHQANAEGGAQTLLKSSRVSISDDRPFAILRYAKLKSVSAIKGSGAHMERTIKTPNADPDRKSDNVVLIGSHEPWNDALALIPKLGARDADKNLLRRKNSVMAVEVLMTSSPEYWKSATQDERAKWVQQSTDWLAEEWGIENVAHLQLHDDETTGHLTGFVVPLDGKGGLNARAFIGGKASKAAPGTSLISGHQTRYAESVENLGLRRGRLGSDATHETVQSYYRRASNVLGEVNFPEIGTPPLIGREQWAADLQKDIANHVSELAVRAAEAPTERRRAVSAGKTADKALKSAEDAKTARRALADQCRQMDLATVAEDMGFELDTKEKRWVSGPAGGRDHKIEITDMRWRCSVMQKGGRGAIDLVQAVQDTDFNGALAYLSNRYGLEAAAADFAGRNMDHSVKRVEVAVSKRPPFKLPDEAPEVWPTVRNHLIEDRGLDPVIVDEAHANGNIYAQAKEGQFGQMINAVFVCRDESGNPTGAEIKSTKRGKDGKFWGACALGTNKKAGVFRAGVQKIAEAVRVIVVESAIDALSALQWIRIDKGYAGAVTVVSTAGDTAELPQPTVDAISPKAKKYAGQDRNRVGEKQARKMEGNGWKRLLPPEPHEDWNEWAQAIKPQEGRKPTDVIPSMSTLPSPSEFDA